MNRVAVGDHATFREVYQRTSAKLFGVCLRILVRRSEAQDALQETYITIWRRAALYDQARGAAMHWMITIARNLAIDRLRRSGRRQFAAVEVLDRMADSAPLASEVLEWREELSQLAGGLQTINPVDAFLVRSAFLDGYTHVELAQLTGIPLNTVKSRVRRALPKLRSCFAKISTVPADLDCPRTRAHR
jgi:RNA polymerase sigma-70 factor (ECF subfamily)